MFPISSEGVFEEPSIFFEQDNFLQDLLADCPVSEGNGQVEKVVAKRSRKASSSSEAKEGSSGSKKTAHKFVEKQRRQEMSSLYASLRSLLPLEYVKGKRAISDHMEQAVIYIEDMKKKTEGMKTRRDELRKMCKSASSSSSVDEVIDGGNSTKCVKINVLINGMEILISSSLNKENFPLSKVLADLLARQLNVINCVSTRVATCYLHKIQIELNDSASMDVAELQRGLEKLIRFA